MQWLQNGRIKFCIKFSFLTDLKLYSHLFFYVVILHLFYHHKNQINQNEILWPTPIFISSIMVQPWHRSDV